MYTEKVDKSQAYKILNEFLATTAWRYAYVNSDWWNWDPDTGAWEYVDTRHRFAATIYAITVDLWPDDRKIQGQVNRDYILNEFLKELRFPLTWPNLPRDPKPGNRPPSALPAP